MTFHVKDVSFRYPGTTEDVLSKISLTLPMGRVIAVLGINGSGKTTLLNLLGLLWDRSPHTGMIQYKTNSAYAKIDRNEKARLRREEFGFVLQNAYLLPHFSAIDNIAMPLAIRGDAPGPRRAEAQRLLKTIKPSDGVEAINLGKRMPRQLSGGQRRLFAVLRAVIHNPHVVFADEPISNLDFQTAEMVLDLLKDWQIGKLHTHDNDRDRTLVLVSHSVDTAFNLADVFVVLHKGELAEAKMWEKNDLPDGPSSLYRLIEHGELES